MVLKKGSRSLANSDSVVLALAATEARHDGSADGRSEPAILSVQPGRSHPGTPFAAPDQSDRHGCFGRTSRDAEALLQPDRPAFDRSCTHAADAHRGLLL